jgi:hypothetical protein
MQAPGLVLLAARDTMRNTSPDIRSGSSRDPGNALRRPGPRIRQEQRTIDAMLGIWCRDHHGHRDRLCDDCAQLRLYAHRRLDTCPFQEEKPVCNRCEVHCYSALRREHVKQVMRYAGPRMPLRHPWLALRHMLDKLRRVPALAQAVARTRRERRQRTEAADDTCR